MAEESAAEPVAPEDFHDHGEAPEPVLTFAARTGTFILSAADEPGPVMYRSLMDALNNDPRVVELRDYRESDLRTGPNSWPQYGFFRPTWEPSEEDEYTATPIPPTYFRVDVPLKNQRTFSGPPPSETYHAAWDGLTLVVSWEAGSEHVYNGSGGHICGDVIKDAAAACGMEVHVQACTPLCEYEFTHTTLLVAVDEETPRVTPAPKQCDGGNLHLRVPTFDVPERETIADHTTALHGDLRSASKHFATVKNYAVRARVLADTATGIAQALLTLQRDRAHALEGNALSRAKKRWAVRGWRRQSRVLIADLWLTIAELEALRGHWFRARDSFEQEVDRLDAWALFEDDYRVEARVVERLPLDSLRAQVQHASDRIDNRDVVVATGVAAIAGALGGVAASGFL